MKAIINGDLVAGIGTGDLPGVDIPPALRDVPAARLRFVGGALVDASTITTWYVAPNGDRHAVTGANRIKIKASFEDEIESDGAGGWRIVDRLPKLKEHLKDAIDAEAERQRQRWITPGAGQAMTYLAKVDEARALTVDPEDPNPDNYPLLAAEVGITAPTLAEVGTIVLQAYQQWLKIGAAIERVRRAAKLAVDLAQTAAAAEALTVNWPEQEG